jgi:hypothetical protein
MPSTVRRVRGGAAVIVLVAALAAVSAPGAFRNPTSAELLWMQQAGFIGGAGTFRDWATCLDRRPAFRHLLQAAVPRDGYVRVERTDIRLLASSSAVGT